MIQSVLAEPAWSQRMNPEDLSSLTPLLFAHVNPYGALKLDMNALIPIEAGVV